jgi:hypothetical protein
MRKPANDGGCQKLWAAHLQISARGTDLGPHVTPNVPLATRHIPRLHAQRRQPNCNLPTPYREVSYSIEDSVHSCGTTSTLDLMLQTATSVRPYPDWDRERADVDGFI